MPASASLALLGAITPQTPSTGYQPTVFIVLMVAGFLIAVIGHVVQAKPVIGFGIACMFVGAGLLVFTSLIVAPAGP